MVSGTDMSVTRTADPRCWHSDTLKLEKGACEEGVQSLKPQGGVLAT